jgi:hypothetical protein
MRKERHAEIVKEADFTYWSDRAERLLKKAIIILLVGLVLAQGALQVPVIRAWLSPAERLEGIPLQPRSHPS